MTNLKKYNIFITITSFTKLLIEVFIPLLLFNIGFKIQQILIFFLIEFLTIVLTIIPISKIGIKIKFKNLMIISSFLFATTYIYLNFLKPNICNLLVLGVLNGLYLITYWLGRHIYGLVIIKDKKTTDNVSLYMIFGILGSLPASFLGAVILNNFGYITLSIIILVLSILSIIPLAKIKTKPLKQKLNLIQIIKTYPIQNYIFYFLEQFKFVLVILFPLYIYINIKQKLEFIGITNLIIGISSIIYIYVLAKKMDKNKKDYLKPMMLFLFFTLLIKLNVKTEFLILIVIFIEGISKSALDTITLRNTYSYSKNYDVVSYITFIELICSIFKCIAFSIFIALDFKLKTILYIGVFTILINTFVGFKQGKSGYKEK